MATVKTFEELQVWQEACHLVNEIYSASKVKPFVLDRDLQSQIRRAAMSTMSNIAEGFERGSRKEFVQFLNIAKGSNCEVRSQLWIALDQEYLNSKRFEDAAGSLTSDRQFHSLSRNLRDENPRPKALTTFNLQPPS